MASIESNKGNVASELICYSAAPFENSDEPELFVAADGVATPIYSEITGGPVADSQVVGSPSSALSINPANTARERVH